MLAGLDSPEASFLGLWMVVFLLCVHMVFLLWASNPEVSLYAHISSSYKHICYIALGPILMALFYSAPFKGPCLLTWSLAKLSGVKSSPCEFEGGTIQSTTVVVCGFEDQ